MPHRMGCHRNVAMSRKKDDRNIFDLTPHELLLQFESCHARHANIENEASWPSEFIIGQKSESALIGLNAPTKGRKEHLL
jgi:hypothetical protein